MSMYVIPCDCTGDSLSCHQPTLPCCHLHLCLCLTPDCQGFSFFWSEHCDFSEVSLFVVGGMRLVYSRWVICATTWSCCCWVGWQSMDSLWITLCVCAWAGHSLEGTYRLSFLCFCPSVGTWSNPTKEGIFFIWKCVWKASFLSSWCSEYSQKWLHFVTLSIACPQMPCLHGLLGLITLCLKWENFFYLFCAVADNCIESHQTDSTLAILAWRHMIFSSWVALSLSSKKTRMDAWVKGAVVKLISKY